MILMGYRWFSAFSQKRRIYGSIWDSGEVMRRKWRIYGNSDNGYFTLFSEESRGVNREQRVPETALSAPKIYERPKMSTFRAGQEIKASVVPPTEDLREIAPEAQAFLRYESFALKDVLLIAIADEAQYWKPGDTRICLFIREEARENCTVLLCEPRVKKNKKG